MIVFALVPSLSGLQWFLGVVIGDLRIGKFAIYSLRDATPSFSDLSNESRLVTDDGYGFEIHYFQKFGWWSNRPTLFLGLASGFSSAIALFDGWISTKRYFRGGFVQHYLGQFSLGNDTGYGHHHGCLLGLVTLKLLGGYWTCGSVENAVLCSWLIHWVSWLSIRWSPFKEKCHLRWRPSIVCSICFYLGPLCDFLVSIRGIRRFFAIHFYQIWDFLGTILLSYMVLSLQWIANFPFPQGAWKDIPLRDKEASFIPVNFGFFNRWLLQLGLIGFSVNCLPTSIPVWKLLS